MSDASFDFDVIVIGAGYGGFDAAKHAAEHGLKTAIVESRDMGGTCVNRGCVPSKALLAASGKVRQLADDKHLASFGIYAAPVRFERQKIADHANQLVQTIRTNLTKTLERAGVTILRGHGRLEGSQKVGLREPSGVDRVLTAKDVIIATGSDPFVPPGIETDGRTVFTSDEAINLEWLPRWIAIIGSGYIGLEFADVYTALGCEVTMIEAMDKVMPTFDPDIAKIAGRHLIDGRDIDARSGLLARKVTPGCPVQIELADFNSRELVETLEVDVEDQRSQEDERDERILRKKRRKVIERIPKNKRPRSVILRPVAKELRNFIDFRLQLADDIAEEFAQRELERNAATESNPCSGCIKGLSIHAVFLENV